MYSMLLRFVVFLALVSRRVTETTDARHFVVASVGRPCQYAWGSMLTGAKSDSN